MNRLKISEEQLKNNLENARIILLNKRSGRIRPHRDDKVLAGWNGLVISASVRSGAVLGESQLIHAAEDAAANFVLEQMVDRRGRLIRS